MAVIGYKMRSCIPVQDKIYFLILFIVLFLTMVMLAQEPGWNMVLLIVFSFTVGTLLNSYKAAFAIWDTWLVFLGLLGMAMIGAEKLGLQLHRNSKALQILSVLYLLGWLVIIRPSLPGWILTTSILIGLVLFVLLSAAVLQRVSSLDHEESPIPLGIELWVLLLNLFWLSSLL